MNKLMAASRKSGGNAVIGMKFETTYLKGKSRLVEVCAYGTACVIVPSPIGRESKQSSRVTSQADRGSLAAEEPECEDKEESAGKCAQVQ